MSTPTTLTHALPPFELDHRQRYWQEQHYQDRYLPPPRPSSNVSYQSNNLPARPSSNLSNGYFAAPPRPQSNMSGRGYTHSHAHNNGQARAGAEYSYTNGLAHQSSHEELKRTNSAASQRPQRPLPPPPQSQSSSHAPAEAPQMPPQQDRDDSAARGQKRGHKTNVDWDKFYGGKPPSEIIMIHDDDSPAPPAEIQRLPPPADDPTTAHHVDKRRRTNAVGGDATYSTTNTPYSQSHGTSTDSLQATTAPTSLGSQISSSSKLDGAQTGQKRKRTAAKAPERDLKKQETDRTGPRGYLAEYGEYVPPSKLPKKQKEVHVPVMHDRHKTTEPIDDDDGHYIVQDGSRLGERYTLEKLLGQGTFGKVVKALDVRTRREVAVKIIRAVPKVATTPFTTAQMQPLTEPRMQYRDASRIELRVLQTLRTADEHNRNRCIQLRDCFDWRGHICIVTPLLGLSVFDFLKSGGFVPFPGSHIQAFARQLLGSIAFLHDLNLIHTDLKPENILLLNHAYQTFTYNRNIPSSSQLTARSAKFRRVLLEPQINLIDFGSATFNDEYHSSVVSTRHYRAPEIILGIGWSHPIDLWSLGCILVECYTGDALFQTHDCAEHLAMMQIVTGRDIDKSLIREVNRTKRERNSAARFFKNNRLQYPAPDTPRQSRKFVRSMKGLEEVIYPSNNFNKLFLDLLRKIFVYDPKKRITAREALKHPWFEELVEDDGTEAARIKEERERTAAAKAAARRT